MDKTRTEEYKESVRDFVRDSFEFTITTVSSEEILRMCKVCHRTGEAIIDVMHVQGCPVEHVYRIPWVMNEIGAE